MYIEPEADDTGVVASRAPNGQVMASGRGTAGGSSAGGAPNGRPPTGKKGGKGKKPARKHPRQLGPTILGQHQKVLTVGLVSEKLPIPLTPTQPFICHPSQCNSCQCVAPVSNLSHTADMPHRPMLPAGPLVRPLAQRLHALRWTCGAACTPSRQHWQPPQALQPMRRVRRRTLPVKCRMARVLRLMLGSLRALPLLRALQWASSWLIASWVRSGECHPSYHTLCLRCWQQPIPT